MKTMTEKVLSVITDPKEQTVVSSRQGTRVYRPSLARIAEVLKVSKPTAQYHVNRLEAEGRIPENLAKPVNQTT